MTDVRSVHGQNVEGPTPVVQSGDVHGALDALSRQAPQGNGLKALDAKAREEPESPGPGLEVGDRFARGQLVLGHRAMFEEIDAAFTGEVRAFGLPGPGPHTRGDAFAAGEGHEAPLDVQRLTQVVKEVRTVVAPPYLGQDHDVRVKTLDDVENLSGPAPAIDARVKVKGRHTHRSTLTGGPQRVWQSLVVDSVDVTFGHRLWWVDCFIGDGERGNPAVVVLLEHPLPDDEMQLIAFEFGVSETAFVRQVGDHWSLRWFTPTVEVDLCGHATVAAVHVLLNELGFPGGRFFFDTRAGMLSGCRLPDGLIGVDLPRLYLEPIHPSYLNGALGDVLEAYQAGPASVLAIVKDYDSLCDLSIDQLSLFLVPSSLIIVACEGGPEADVSIRVFAPRLGLAEDPVTGSAMCALAPWWVEKSGSPTVTVRQASSRGGMMYARLFESNVEVAGMTRTFFSGEIYP